MNWKWRLFVHSNTGFLGAWFAAAIITGRSLYLVYSVVSFALLAHACWAAEQNEVRR